MGRPPLDLDGVRFGRLVAVRISRKDNGVVYWWCRCDCGREYEVRRGNLMKARSCGCEIRERMTKHGHTSGSHKEWTREYKIWLGMRQRCMNPRNAKYRDYGARGISVCERWNDFPVFLADMGSRPSPKHTIDRIDNDGNYEPGNCRWLLAGEQVRNQRRSKLTLAHVVEIRRLRKEGRTLKELAARFGVSFAMIGRISRGVSWR